MSCDGEPCSDEGEGECEATGSSSGLQRQSDGQVDAQTDTVLETKSDPLVPLITIIICCYNRADYIYRTICSALEQSYANTEIIVFDDGSTDATAEVVGRFGDRVRYHRQDNSGIAIARTRALKLAQGQFIAYLDDDDLMPRDRIKRLLDAHQRHPNAAFVVGDLELIDAYDQPIPGTRSVYADAETVFSDGYAAVMWPQVPATVHTTLFAKAKAKHIGYFDASFHQAGEDKDFFARLGQTGPVVYVPEVVSLYRTGHASLSRNVVKISNAQLRLLCRAIDDGLIEDKATIRRLQDRVSVALLRKLTAEQIANTEPANDAAASVPNISVWRPSRYLPMRQLIALWRGRLRHSLKRLF